MSYKKFVHAYLLALCITAILILGILYYLSKVFEHNSFESIVKRQLDKNSIYGTALNENVFAYKLELIKQRQPKIIALGSSRVGQLREGFFNNSFVSASNAMNTLKEGRYFLEEILKIYKPEIVILGLESWFFNPLFPNFKEGEYFNITGTNLSGTKLLDILHLIYKKQFFQLHYLVENDFITNPYSNLDSLGLNAMYNGRGFFKDGSYLYGEIFTTKPHKDAHFQDTLQRVEKGLSQFVYASHMDMSRMDDLSAMLDMLRANHIPVIIFFPPMAPDIYRAMQEKPKHYAYINEVFATLKRENIHFFNYFDPTILRDDNCEFLDGFHGGDIFYARMLRDMAQKDDEIARIANMPYLNTLIATQAGKVFSKDSVSQLKEQDFLQLGCKK